MACADSVAGLGPKPHPVALLLHRSHGCAQPHCIPEPLGQPIAQLLAAAGEVVLLRPALELGQRGQSTARLQVEEEVQKRQLLDLGTEYELRSEVEEHPCVGGAKVAAGKRVDGLRIPVGHRRLHPGMVERHLLPQAVEAQLGDAELRDRQRREWGQRSPEGAPPPARQEHRAPIQVLRLGPHAELAGKRGDAILRRTDPVRPEVGVVAADAGGPHLAPDALAGLQHRHRASPSLEPACGAQPAQPSPDDRDVHRGIIGQHAVHARLRTP